MKSILTCAEDCSRRQILKTSAIGLGALWASSLSFPNFAFAGKPLRICITGRCIFNSIVVTNEEQAGLPNIYRAKTPFDFAMNDDCAGLEMGLQAVLNDKADIGTLLRALTDEEKTAGLQEVTLDPMAYAIAVNKKNPVNDLSFETVLNIFAGNIQNWQEVGGEDMDILLYKQKCGASYDNVMEKLFAKHGITKNQQRLEEAVMYVEVTDNQLEEIANNEMAISMVPRMFFDSNSKHLKIGGISPSRATEKDGSYPFMAQRSLVIKQQPSATVTSFIDYIKSPEGLEIAEKGYAMDWLATGF